MRRRLKNDGLILKIGPFSFRLISSIELVAADLERMYSEYQVLEDGCFVDFCVVIKEGTGLRRWFGRQAIFEFDGMQPFSPLPIDHAFPLLEWSMNWCISMHANHYLLLHAAVIERNGRAVVMPAPPGSGKSTLCAGLIHRGWRLLSDELALISLVNGDITPLGRPVSLKNNSIDVIRAFEPEAIFSRAVKDTSKGTVALLQVPKPHLEHLGDVAKPQWIIFPRYADGSMAELRSRPKVNSMLELGRNSFNYSVLGLRGFNALSALVDACDCYDFQYSRLEDAVQIFDGLVFGDL
jgi:HprK-related kinase A